MRNRSSAMISRIANQLERRQPHNACGFAPAGSRQALAGAPAQLLLHERDPASAKPQAMRVQRYFMRSFGRATLAITVLLAILGGAALGTALGYLDVWFLSGRVSFTQPAAYLTIGQLLVRYLPMAVNGLFGAVLGLVAGILVLFGLSPKQPTLSG